MLRKLNLDGTRRYEIAVACNRTAKMIAAFIDGNEGSKSIGSEQGGIPRWDDFVVEDFDGSYTHIQVKRQNTDFSDNPVTRGSRPRAGGLQPLSPIDESIAELSTWLNGINLATLFPKRRFVVELPDGEIAIKQGFTVNHFRHLCNDTIQDTTTLARFDDLIANDAPAANVAEWMKTWCGFADNSQVLEALKLLHVSRSGNEEDIEEATKEILRRFFTDVENVYLILYGLVQRTSTFVSCLTPKAVLSRVLQFLLPTVIDWTHYTLNGTVYEKRGTHDKRDNSIEHPSVVVSKLWNLGRRGLLKLTAQTDITHKLPRAIVRLALHLQAGTIAHLSDDLVWREQAKRAVGGTLGLGENDFDALATVAYTGSINGAEFIPLTTIAEHETEADLLSDEMQREVWAKVHHGVHAKIADLPNTELRSAVERRFVIWNQALSNNIMAQRHLCTSMLHPAAEGDDIVIEFRVGPKTVHLISKGIFYLLIVSVAMTANDDSWEQVDNELTVQVKANSFWSGPAGAPRKPRRLSAIGSDKLLAAEPGKILVLSETESSPTEVRGSTLADDDPISNLAAPREPQIIVTGCRKFDDLIQVGDIANIRDYLNSISIKTVAA